ncbi:MAG: pitrilysin family protein [Vicinamibacterales bacterium]
MSTRFDLPQPGAPTAVHFPPIARETMPGGLRVWSIPAPAAPLAAVLLVVEHGSARDPEDQPGLVGLTADLMDEGAGNLDAIAVADAFMRLGTHLEIEVAPDVTTFGLTALTRVLPEALALLADVVIRPRLEARDFDRIRDLRLNRLRQLSRSPSAVANRVFNGAVFAAHPYARGTLGTTVALRTLSADDTRAQWAEGFERAGATLVVAGDVTLDAIRPVVERTFGTWGGGRPRTPLPAVSLAGGDAAVLLVDRPGASQSELRVGHSGPPRRTEAYFTLLTLNAVLGGQFSSRINRNLRETRGVTYGARTAFEFRRAGGSFGCDTSVQSDATADAIAEILREFETIRSEPVGEDELALARSSLTRGYVRNFETAVQLGRAGAQLAVHDLGSETYDDFVPIVGRQRTADLAAAAHAYLQPDRSTIVVVGDRETIQPSLAALGRPVRVVTPEF